MRHIVTILAVCGMLLSTGFAEAEPLSGGQLKAKLSDTTLILSKNGRKTRRRMELILHKNGTGGSLHVPSGQIIPLTWRIQGRELCMTQKKDGKTFCMATNIEGETVVVQMGTGGKTRTLKGSITPF